MKQIKFLILIGSLMLTQVDPSRADEVFLAQANLVHAAALSRSLVNQTTPAPSVAVPVNNAAVAAPVATSPLATSNVAQLSQVGVNNSAAIIQSGVGNLALVSQQGRGNVAMVMQSGRAR